MYKCIYTYIPTNRSPDGSENLKRRGLKEFEEEYDEAEINEIGEALDMVLDMVLNMEIWENRNKQSKEEPRKDRIIRRKEIKSQSLFYLPSNEKILV